ncbi:hypothetical protein COLO4_29554 [Corchorus olitorius]|uniref:F-box domain-containing protein n=1 Tax=Corchorus olitorius TaxID=93759 RepID=A0A1R3HE75_9ROSI|nr:hypothetical protein COLO4_29554 [Corchorus olitorius]
MGFIRKGNKKARVMKGRENNRDWGGLPDNIVDMISERLPLIDCVSMSRVCNSWCNVLKQSFPNCNKRPRGLPWLVMSKQQENIFRSCYSVLQQGNNNNSKLRKLDLPEAYGKYFWGSFQDWLIAVERIKYGNIMISLLNPFTRVQVNLPQVFQSYHKLVLSGSPSDQTSTIYLLLGEYYGIDIALWFPGSDGWCNCKVENIKDVFFRDSIFFNGYFYLLTEDYNIHLLDAGKARSEIMKQGSSAATITTQIYKLQKPENIPECGFVIRNLVESNGNVLLVCRFFRYLKNFKRTENYDFKVYRLEHQGENMAWKSLDDLGDQVLFMGRNCCASFSTKDLGDEFANCVFFTNQNQGGRGPPIMNEWENSRLRKGSDGRDWGVFSLNSDHKFSYVAKPSRSAKWGPIWLTAPLGWC